jgi:hypothetical protein
MLLDMPTHDTDLRELDHRVSDGIEVRLMWRPADDQPLVTVSDGKTGESFTVLVMPHQRAYDVFHHPFAYGGEPAGEPDLTGAGR